MLDAEPEQDDAAGADGGLRNGRPQVNAKDRAGTEKPIARFLRDVSDRQLERVDREGA